jgi:hypothetical protein
MQIKPTWVASHNKDTSTCGEQIRNAEAHGLYPAPNPTNRPTLLLDNPSNIWLHSYHLRSSQHSLRTAPGEDSEGQRMVIRDISFSRLELFSQSHLIHTQGTVKFNNKAMLWPMEHKPAKHRILQETG